MVAATNSEVVRVANPAGFIVDSDRVIKGFVSVSTLDRSRHYVKSNQFNIDKFMASPAIFVNHRHWIDENGNRVGVGAPLSMHEVVLKASSVPDEWLVVDSKSGEVISTYPKNKVPDLKEGTQGVFAFVRITREDVWKMIVDGELSAFSWKGVATVNYRPPSLFGKEAFGKSELTDIDLWEFSLVNVPVNANSTFVISKSIGEVESYPIYLIRLNKNVFTEKEDAVKFLKSHALSDGPLLEDEECYSVLQRPSAHFQLGKLIAVKMTDGVSMVAGPLVEELDVAPLSKSDVDRFTLLESSKGQNMSTVTDKSQETATAVETPAAETVVSKSAPEVAAASSLKLEDIVAGVVNGLKGVFAPVLESMQSASNSMQMIASKMVESKTEPAITPAAVTHATTAVAAPATTTTEEVSKGVAGDDPIGEIQDTLTLLGKGMLVLNSKLDGLAKSAPKQIAREEVVKGAATEEDPNAVFDNMLPFTSRKKT